MLPYLLWAGGAAVVALVVGAVTAGWEKSITDKSVMLVGPRLAGKTLLHTHLTSGARSKQELAGNSQENFNFVTGDVKMEGLKWRVQAVESPTTKGTQHEMAVHLASADLGVFVADASMLSHPSYRTNAESLTTALRNMAPDHVVWLLVLTHADLLDPSPDDGQAAAHHLKLAKLLDDPEPLLCDLTDVESSGLAVGRVLARLVEIST